MSTPTFSIEELIDHNEFCGAHSFVQATSEANGTTDLNGDAQPQATAPGKNAVAFGVRGQSAGDCSLTSGYLALALERGCVAFGTARAGRTGSEWIAYYYDTANDITLNGGMGLLEVPTDSSLRNDDGSITAPADKGIIEKEGKYYYVLGTSSTKYNTFLLNVSFAAGHSAKAIGYASSAFGNATLAKAKYSTAFGDNTQSLADHGFAGGCYTINNAQKGFVYGYRLTTGTAVGQAVFGEYNQRNDNAVFQVGTGYYVNKTSTKNYMFTGFEVLKYGLGTKVYRKTDHTYSYTSPAFEVILCNGTSQTTSFEITKDGYARAYKAPVNKNDLVRKQDLLINNLGVYVEGDPTAAASKKLEKIRIGDVIYSIPDNTSTIVIANSTASETSPKLRSVKINNITYRLPEGQTAVKVGNIVQDSWNADTKIDKWKASTTHATVLSLQTSGLYTAIPISSTPVPGAIMMYNTYGNLQTGDPVQSADCVNKSSFDRTVGDIQTLLTRVIGGEI